MENAVEPDSGGVAARMRVLIVHTETRYFAGAQKMLGYFLDSARATGLDLCLAYAPSRSVRGLAPPGLAAIEIPQNQQFSWSGWIRQARAVGELARREQCGLIHAWTARDWEAAALGARWGRLPTIGTLHDHPQASFISRPRRWLMRCAANRGLARVVCVSSALRDACLRAGYRSGKLRVIHNGLPQRPAERDFRVGAGTDVFRVGFLGAFVRRKGLAGFFAMLDGLAASGSGEWEAWVAGGAQSEEGEQVEAEVRSRYGAREWWSRVRWLGWVADPAALFSRIDVLVCCSTEFDPFPTVLIEAGYAAVPVLATRVGGVVEIVGADGHGGWLIEPGAWEEGGRVLARLGANRELARSAGQAHGERVRGLFTAERMSRNYASVYAEAAGRS